MDDAPEFSTNDGEGAAPGGCAAAARRLIVLSDVRFLREGLAEVLARDGAFRVAVAADLDEAMAAVAVEPPQLMLIDAALAGGIAAAAQLRRVAPEIRIVALALSETEQDVIAWAEAGVCGYVPRTAALAELVDLLDKIARGEQSCSTRVAASLLRRIADGARGTATAPPPLTQREEEVVRLLGAGLSNKEIARRLDIGLATIKSHVHNVLAKLALERRSQVVRWMRANEPVFSASWTVAPQPARAMPPDAPRSALHHAMHRRGSEAPAARPEDPS